MRWRACVSGYGASRLRWMFFSRRPPLQQPSYVLDSCRKADSLNGFDGRLCGNGVRSSRVLAFREGYDPYAAHREFDLHSLGQIDFAADDKRCRL